MQILWRNLKWYAYRWDSIHTRRDPAILPKLQNIEDVRPHPNGVKVTWREVQLEVTCHTCLHRVQLCAGCYEEFRERLKVTHKPICPQTFFENNFQRKHYRAYEFLNMRELQVDPRIYS